MSSKVAEELVASRLPAEDRAAKGVDAVVEQIDATLADDAMPSVPSVGSRFSLTDRDLTRLGEPKAGVTQVTRQLVRSALHAPYSPRLQVQPGRRGPTWFLKFVDVGYHASTSCSSFPRLPQP